MTRTSRAQISEYLRPQSPDEAWRLIESGAPTRRLLAGGTDLTITCPPEVTTLIDLAAALPGDIALAADGSIDIGAMATFAEIAEHPAVRKRASGVVTDMLGHVGSPLLRNVCTLGGHLARGRLSDVIPVMIALDAAVTIYTGSSVTIPLAEYYDGAHHKAPHLVTGIHLPPLTSATAAYSRFARTAFDFPIINACCRVDHEANRVTEVRIVLGATPHRAQRARQTEQLIRDHGLSPTAINDAVGLARTEIVTGSAWVASAEYRTHLVGVLVARCLQHIVDRAVDR